MIQSRRPLAELSAVRLERSGHLVLDGVDLQVRPDEIVAVVGGSGSGKTTLLDTLIGLLAPVNGDVYLFGQPVYGVEPDLQRALLGRVGVVFQHDALFQAMTVADNLGVAARELLSLPQPVIDELISIRLEQVGLTGFADRHPYELSGGQQKRVAFARAVMLEPDLVVCDEPTAGLDPINSAKIAELIVHLRDQVGAAVLIVTHDVDFAQSAANRIVVLGRGRILAAGSAVELRAHADPLVTGLIGGGKGAPP